MSFALGNLSRRYVTGSARRCAAPSVTGSGLKIRWRPKTRIQLVALDIDGTLLDAQKQVHPRVKAAILQASALGVPVLLSTGRCPAAAFKLVNNGCDTPLASAGGVFLGGALGLDSFGKVRHDVKLPSDIVKRVLAQADVSGLTPVLITHDNFWCATQNHWTDWLVAAGDPAAVGVGKIALQSTRRTENVNLVCLMGDKNLVDANEAIFRELLQGSAAQVVRPMDMMLDVVPVSGELAGKAAALATLCALRGVPAGAVMAVGDSGNDVDMLRWAGWSVAMGNASEAAREAADVSVASNTDADRPGVAEALEDFVIRPAQQ